MKDFSIKVTVRSKRLIDAIERKFGSQAEMARQAGIPMSQINGLVTLRNAPTNSSGWTSVAEDISAALGLYPSDLWPDHLKDVRLKRATADFSLDIEEVKSIISDTRDGNLSHLLGKAAHGIPDRNLKAVRMNIEGATLEEIGSDLGVTRERARQILWKGLRLMKGKLSKMGVRSVTDAI